LKNKKIKEPTSNGLTLKKMKAYQKELKELIKYIGKVE
jgi:hypothetical protein